MEANNNLEKLTKHYRLDNSQKHVFYRILKRLLEEPKSLEDGKWDEDCCGNYKFELIYGKKRCKVTVMDFEDHIYQQGVVATLDIYLRWRETDCASLSNLQKVENELKFLGAGDFKVNACFSLARHLLSAEPSHIVRNNCTLQIICDEIVLSFVSGDGSNEITVLYDDKKKTAVHYISGKWKGCHTQPSASMDSASLQPNILSLKRLSK